MTQDHAHIQDKRAVRHLGPTGRNDTNHLATRPRVAVVGAGIAGMAAAACLAERGVDVRLLERESTLGGRCGGWRTTLHDGSTVPMNRGFHAFFRQYYNLRSLLRRGNSTLSNLVAMSDYPLSHSDGYQDTFSTLPRTPLWNALAFALRSPTFAWRDIAKLSTHAALPLADVTVPGIYRELDHIDAASFLDRIGFPPPAKHLAFQVFSRSFFADPAELSAAELATMFHIYFLGSNEGLLFDVAADCFPLALWTPLARYLERCGVSISTSTSVESVTDGHQRRFATILDDGRPLEVDGIVLATNVDGSRRLVEDSPCLGDSSWRARIAEVPTAAPFLVSRLWLDRPVRQDRPGFMGTSGYGPLDNVSVLDRYERSARQWCQRTGGSVLELHSYALPEKAAVDESRARAMAELHRVYPETRFANVIDERHDVRRDCPLFAPGGFGRRPGIHTPTPRLVLAGDFVRIDLPVALMERAATTGMAAANALLRDWGLRGHTLWTVPVQGRYAPLRRLAKAVSGDGSTGHRPPRRKA